MSYLSVEDLRVSFRTEDGIVRAVDGVSFEIDRGRTLAIVGESGSGKSVTVQTVMGLVNQRNADVTGRVLLDGTELVGASDDELRRLRGSAMSMVFQDPFASLHPFYRIGDQLAEAVLAHHDVGKSEARARALAMLREVGIPNAEQRIEDYPHQLSGGMRQRVMIAMALINGPSLLIADEPTTALDVTVQAQILELMSRLQEQYDTAIVLITHDLGIVADIADEVAVMYAGSIVEQAGLDELYYAPRMPYTVGLLSSVPRLDSVAERLAPIPGQPPSLINRPSGCAFHPRCSVRHLVPGGRCEREQPALEAVVGVDGHLVRCHLDDADRRAHASESLAAVRGVAP